jgi:ABC-2 type transport system permease protein
MRGLIILLAYRLRMLKNTLSRWSQEKIIKTVIIVGVGAGFIIGDYILFFRIIRYLKGVEIFGSFLLFQLLATVFLTFFSLLFFSNILTALSTFYISRDLDLLFSKPLPVWSVFGVKFLENIINSSWMVVLFGLPIFVALGKAYQASWFYYLLVPGVLIPFLLIPAGLGVGATVLLMRILPAKRAKELFSFVGLTFGAFLVIFFRLLKPEKLLSPKVSLDDFQNFLSYFEAFQVSSASFLPSTWATKALIAAQGADYAALFLPHSLLLGAAAFCFLGSLVLAHKMHFMGWSGAQETRLRRKSFFHLWDSPLLQGLLARLHPTSRALVDKDLKTFFRDTTQWSQLFMLLALVVVYIININSLPWQGYYYKNLASFINLALVGFVLAAVSARFLYPTTSLEAGSFWILQSAPLSYQRFLWEKFFLFLLPLLLLAEVLVVATNILLGVDGSMMLLSVVTVFFMTLSLAGLGVGMGAIYPRFRFENPAQVAMGSGGILYMILALAFVGLVVVLEAWPVYNYFGTHLSLYNVFAGKRFILSPKGGGPDVYLPFVIIFLLNLLMIFLPIRLGAKALEKTEV